MIAEDQFGEFIEELASYDDIPKEKRTGEQQVMLINFTIFTGRAFGWRQCNLVFEDIVIELQREGPAYIIENHVKYKKADYLKNLIKNNRSSYVS